jgi:hypothetical protein
MSSRLSKSNSNKKSENNVQYGKLNKLRQHLETAEFGLTISQIAEDLKLSRNTAKNYLEILRNEGCAYCREVGPAKIWFSQKTQEIVPESRIPGFLRAFLMQTLYSIEKLIHQPPDSLDEFYLTIGRDVGKKVAWPGEVDFLRNAVDGHDPRMIEIKPFVEQFISVIEDTGVFLKAEIVPPVKDEPDSPILIRATFHNAEWGQFKQYYNLMAGYFESKLKMVFGDSLYLITREIQPEGLWCYYELGIIKNEGKGVDLNDGK